MFAPTSTTISFFLTLDFTISVSIGQGQVSVTPISMAVMMATAVNGGIRVTPYLLKAVEGPEGWIPHFPPSPRSIVRLKPERRRVGVRR